MWRRRTRLPVLGRLWATRGDGEKQGLRDDGGERAAMKDVEGKGKGQEEREACMEWIKMGNVEEQGTEDEGSREM